MYDHHFKTELATKIGKIKSKRIQYQIFELIGDEKNCSHNENGTFIFFQNLSDETYEKLHNYVESIYASKAKKEEKANVAVENIENKELDNIIADINTEKLKMSQSISIATTTTDGKTTNKRKTKTVAVTTTAPPTVVSQNTH
jgi:hypothetical protein